jgi:RNA 3'-terminal phosphate cyclase (ATP)
VAARVYRDAKAYRKAKAPVGEYLADQLLMPMGLAAGIYGQASSFVTTQLSDHSTTHVEILKRFLDIQVDIEQVDALVKVSIKRLSSSC